MFSLFLFFASFPRVGIAFWKALEGTAVAVLDLNCQLIVFKPRNQHLILSNALLEELVRGEAGATSFPLQPLKKRLGRHQRHPRLLMREGEGRG
jgi:hypothetical protein